MNAETIRARIEKTHDARRLQALALKLVAEVERLERRLAMSQLKEMAALNRAAEMQTTLIDQESHEPRPTH